MGSEMIKNMIRDGLNVKAHDAKDGVVKDLSNKVDVPQNLCSESIENISKNCSVIFSMLPNDVVVTNLSNQLMANTGNNTFTHISCSTISPTTSRALAKLHSSNGHQLITAPVFARPDGLARREATWMVAGDSRGKAIASKLLHSSGSIVDMGDDVGAANVVK
jgi:3-hydroxyisobutyrate dehydrogenase-like beta-hydroxyacid dehydrogenase